MPETLLLVDDDREFRQEFAESLAEYTILQAANGTEALAILKKPHTIDLVLLDVMMPGLSGTEVLRQIRTIAPGLGIVILTGYSSKDIIIDALKGHADDYLEKPLDVEKAKETIEAVLGSKRREGSLTQGMKGKIDQVKQFLRRNCFKKVGLVDVASSVCLSPKYLSRIFEENTGMRFTEFRLALKISKSKELLKKSGLNIDQIADKLGYKNTESFIRQFKKITGKTPTEFRTRKSRRSRKR